MARIVLCFVVALGMVVPGTLSGQGYTVVHSFSSEDGSPYAGLVQAADGRF